MLPTMLFSCRAFQGIRPKKGCERAARIDMTEGESDSWALPFPAKVTYVNCET